MPPRRRTEWLRLGTGKTYFHRTHQPLQCLIFLLPLLALYQIGSTLRPWSQGQDQPPQVIAFILMLRFFALFGAAGTWLPALAVVAILLAWHVARKDRVYLKPTLYWGMLGESVLWAIPVLVIGFAVFRKTAAEAHWGGPASVHLAGGITSHLPWQTEAVLSIGAGIYEELLFRLVAITVLNILLVDIFELSIPTAIPIIIVASSVLFSMYHYLGNENFAWYTFFYRTAAGIYFAGIFIFRGFGIDVGSHAAYDLMILGLEHVYR